MMTRSKLFFSLVLVSCVGLLNGCGGGSSATTASSATASADLSGRATQSPISGGTVFADRVVGGVSNFIQDAGEVVAPPTAANGLYRLPTPSYAYILVSKDGTDTVSGLKQILMLAPSGSANITPLTTLVSLDTTGNLVPKVQALQGGMRFDSDVYTNSSPAVLMLIKSVEISVQSLTETFRQKSGDTLSNNQIYGIQARVLQEIAKKLTSTTLDFAVPANLNSVLIAALESAIPLVKAENTNISILPGEVTAISASVANMAVNATALALNRTGNTDMTPLSKLAGVTTAESMMVSHVSSLISAQNSTISALSAPAFSIAASATPSGYSPPTFAIQIIAAAILTGSIGGSGSF